MLCLDKTMQYKILNEYFDKGLNRKVLKNEILDLEFERVESLKKVGIFTEKHIESEQNQDSKKQVKKGK